MKFSDTSDKHASSVSAMMFCGTWMFISSPSKSALNERVTDKFMRIVLPRSLLTRKAIIDPLCSKTQHITCCYHLLYPIAKFMLPKRRFWKDEQFYGSQTKILEGRTSRSMSLFEALFKGVTVSIKFGLQIVEKCFEKESSNGSFDLPKSSFGEHKIYGSQTKILE
jgi:hypothetical protein